MKIKVKRSPKLEGFENLIQSITITPELWSERTTLEKIVEVFGLGSYKVEDKGKDAKVPKR